MSRIIDYDFVAAGIPTYIVAVSGVTYLDITTGIRYKQTTIPYGKNWVRIEAELVYQGVNSSTTINTSSPLTGGGNLAADRTIGIQQSGPASDGYLSSADWVAFNGKQGALKLTTSGTSGPSTLIGGTLNIPDYTTAPAGTTWNVLIDGGTFVAPSDNTLIDGGLFV